ncbi:MAG: hypothetical protein AMJ46_09890 [Latescibacteria bacterium DG_63]|nr:MAG: hypothetical protein AMJ46_09890 [Latescibacteria bacterium DG_63]
MREDTMTIIGVAELGGEDYFLTDVNFAFRSTTEGLSVALYEGSDFSNFEVLLRYPIVDGGEYKYSSPRVSQPELLVRMMAREETTPSGQYKTCTYEFWDLLGTPQLFLTFSFAPRAGMVAIRNSVGSLWLLSAVILVEHEPNWPLQPATLYRWR